jgi:cysteine synthase
MAVAALELARRLGSVARVVTPLVDSGMKYLAGELYSSA